MSEKLERQEEEIPQEMDEDDDDIVVVEDLLCDEEFNRIAENATPLPRNEIAQEKETCIFTPSDFISEMWNAQHTALRNFRTIITSISKYLASEKKKSDPESRSVYEGEFMKSLFVEIYRALNKQKNPIVQYCRKEDVVCFLRINVPRKFYNLFFIEGLMTQKTYREWCSRCAQYIKTIESMSKSPCLTGVPIVTEASMTRHVERTDAGIEIVASTSGVDATTRSAEKTVTKSDVGAGIGILLKNLENVPCSYSQHIYLRDSNGRISSMKTLGEHGPQFVRMQIYDTKDIDNKDQKIWWKYAKLRTQFFIFQQDPKDELLGQLVEQVGMDLKKVPGVKTEIKQYGNE